MALLTNTTSSELLTICYGYLGPYDSLNMCLQGDRIANEWMYCIIKSLDGSNNERMKFTIKDPNGDIQLIANDRQPIDFKPYFNNTVLAQNDGNNLLYYIAINPKPYTSSHTFDIINDSTTLPVSDKIRFVIPILGKCKANNNELINLQIGVNKPGTILNIEKTNEDIVVVLTRQ